MRREGQWLLIALAVAQIVAAALQPLFHIGQSIAARTQVVHEPIVPANYAFGIWGVIYVAILAAVIVHGRSTEMLRLFGPLVLAFAATTAWPLWVTLRGYTWPNLIIIGVDTWALLIALYEVRHSKLRLLRWSIGIFAGWVTAAAFVDVVLTGAPDRNPNAAVATLLFATAIAVAATLYSRLNPGFYLAFAWALQAIVVANRRSGGDGLIAAVAQGAISILLMALVAARSLTSE